MWTGPHQFGPIFSRIQKRKDRWLRSMALGVKRLDWTGLPNTSDAVKGLATKHTSGPTGTVPMMDSRRNNQKHRRIAGLLEEFAYITFAFLLACSSFYPLGFLMHLCTDCTYVFHFCQNFYFLISF